MTFRDQLESAAFRWPVRESRFIRLLERGRCPTALLQRYASKLHAQAVAFPPLLARLINISHEPEVRLHLLENLMEEEGIFLRPEFGLRVNPEAHHTAWSARFALATGITSQQLDATVIGWKETTVRKLISEDRWLEAISYLMLGIEANVPRTFTAMLPGLQRAGYSERELTVFTAHIVADIEHGDSAFNIVEKFSVTPLQQELALKAVTCGSLEWWRRHNGSPATNRTDEMATFD